MADASDGTGPELIAYHGRGPNRVAIVPASRWRDWMEETTKRFANRCLPLLMANEAGWAVLNPVGFTAMWGGGRYVRDLVIEFDEVVDRRPPVESNFGYGILTWGVPPLFRTPPGYNLLARGPANLPKDGVSPLEGLVETDWSVTTFTMNWKITRPHHPIRFERGEPYCVVVPQRRGELESFRAVHRDLAAEPELASGVRAFRKNRDDLQKRKFIADFIGPEAEAWAEWEGTYFRGRYPDGRAFPGHQTKLRLRTFEDERSSEVEATAPAPEPASDLSTLSEAALAGVYAVPAHVQFRPFRRETVVVDLERQLHIELNAVAGRMLGLLSQSHSVGSTAEIIAKEYRQPTSVVQRDVIALCGQLVEAGLLVARTADSAPG